MANIKLVATQYRNWNTYQGEVIIKLDSGMTKEPRVLVVQMHAWKIGLYESLLDRRAPGFDDVRCDSRQGKQIVLECR